MGKPDEVVGRREVPPNPVACQPATDVVATGFRDGCVELARPPDGRHGAPRAPCATS